MLFFCTYHIHFKSYYVFYSNTYTPLSTLFWRKKKMRRAMISQAATVRWCNVPRTWCFLSSQMWTEQQFHWLQHKTRAGVRGSSHVLCCSPWPSHRSPSALPLLLQNKIERHTLSVKERKRGCGCVYEKERKMLHVLNTTSITNTENSLPVLSGIGVWPRQGNTATLAQIA